MPTYEQPITAYPDVNLMLDILFPRIHTILGDELMSLYLDGSLTSGDFDEDSDIDFVVVTRSEIPEATFVTLREMHDQVQASDSIWAIQLEGSYLSQRAVRAYDPNYVMYPNIERGAGERLKLARHDRAWDTHRWVLRERGIVVLGTHPRELIDPVTPEQLKEGMRPLLSEWLPNIAANPKIIDSRGYQSYVVLTICRMLYTLETGGVASKPAAVRWAYENIDPGWHGLIERAWVSRHHSGGKATQEEIQETVDLIRFCLRFGSYLLDSSSYTSL